MSFDYLAQKVSQFSHQFVVNFLNAEDFRRSYHSQSL